MIKNNRKRTLKYHYAWCLAAYAAFLAALFFFASSAYA